MSCAEQGVSFTYGDLVASAGQLGFDSRVLSSSPALFQVWLGALRAFPDQCRCHSILDRMPLVQLPVCFHLCHQHDVTWISRRTLARLGKMFLPSAVAMMSSPTHLVTALPARDLLALVVHTPKQLLVRIVDDDSVIARWTRLQPFNTGKNEFRSELEAEVQLEGLGR